MKFQNLKLFFSQFEKMVLDKSISIALIAISSDEERHHIARCCCRLIGKGQEDLLRFDQLDDLIIFLKGAARAPNLWDQGRLVLFDLTQQPATKIIWADFFRALSSSPLCLILSASSFSLLEPLYEEGRRGLIALDLSKEKPWEEKARLTDWIGSKVAIEGKKISSEAIAHLVEHATIAQIDHALEQLFCYLGEKRLIEKVDIEEISLIRNDFSGWQMAEKLVWETPVEIQEEMQLPPLIFSFIGQIRYHLQLGYQMGELQAASVYPKRFSMLRPLARYLSIAEKRGSFFFQRGLEELYKFEYGAKTGAVSKGLFFDRFQGKLYQDLSF